MRQLCLLAVALLAGCAPQAAYVVAPDGTASTDRRTVWTGSQRSVAGAPEGTLWYSRIDVSVPPDRQNGTMNAPTAPGNSDPRTQFLIADGDRFSGTRGFTQALVADLGRRAAGDRDISLFIHGYNTSFASGVYRTAQLAEDLDQPGIQAHFSWPSRMKPYAYAGDRDAAMFSRDGLVEMIDTLSALPERGDIVLVAHSMGGQLLMEALRQLALSGRRDVIGQIDGVVLISPDIDINLFRAQTNVIGVLPQPFVILTSGRDRALGLSALLANEPMRLGNMPDASAVSDLNVEVVDTAAFTAGIGHFNVANSPALQAILRQVRDLTRSLPPDGSAQPGPLTGAATGIERAIEIVLSP